MYHKYAHKGRFNAEEDQKMLTYYDGLKRRDFRVIRGHKGDHRQLEDVILRPNQSIFGKVNQLKSKEFGEKSLPFVDLQRIAKLLREEIGARYLSKWQVNVQKIA